MDFDKIKYFISLYEIGSFVGAAKHNFISQSTLSKHIKNLEFELDAELINRYGTNGRPTLTTEGKIFLNYAYEAYSTYLNMKKMVEESSKNKKETLRIGVLPLVEEYSIIDTVNKFWLKHPQLQITVTERSQADLIKSLKLGIVAYAIIRTDMLNEPTIETENLITDKLVVICNNRHPISRKKIINIHDLENEEFILLEPNSDLNGYFNTICKANNFIPKISYFQTRHKAILSAVDNGMAISVLPEKLATRHSFENVVAIPFDEDYLTTIGIAKLRASETSKIQETFKKCLIKHFT